EWVASLPDSWAQVFCFAILRPSGPPSGMLPNTLLLLLPVLTFQDGLIEIPAGKTVFGADLGNYKKLIAAKPAVANQLGADVPRMEVDVASFLMSPTEVTNEMYLQFVQGTGYQPPVSWLVMSAEDRLALIAEQQKENPSWIFEGLYKSRWWDEHWQNEGMEWEMPAEQALFPVVNVSWEDARAYCRWAGLRLPTEQEWVRAARGDGKQDWPFGADFDRELVAHLTTQPNNLAYKLLPINAMPSNASAYGLVDMAGNAWEWTDSMFLALDGFKTFTVKAKDGEKVTVLPPFDGSAPVIRGGAFNIPDYGTTVDRRHGVQSIARIDSIGFRVASSLLAGANSVRYAAENIDALVLGEVAQDGLDFNQILGLEQRRYADLEAAAAKRAAPEDGLPETTHPDGYAIFDRYDCLTLTPVKSLSFTATSKLAKATTENAPIPVAVLHTTQPLRSPSLTPGTYILAYQGPLKANEILAKGAATEEGEKPAEDAVGPGNEHPDYSSLILGEKKEYLIVLDLEGTALSAHPLATKLALGTAKKTAHEIILDEGGQQFLFDFKVLDQRGKKAFSFNFPIVPLDSTLLGKDAWQGEFKVKPAE
ncbi:MAG: formylglycine-generating enzyme family protein, partial [Planctomycetes bacterium]|nr:formylglycine-generating enzyme family protein [Planctomycetota bacterium]